MQTSSRPPLTAEDRVQSQASQCGICGGENCTGTGFSLSTSLFSCQYQSDNAPYSFIHLPPTLYNIRNRQRHHITHLHESVHVRIFSFHFKYSNMYSSKYYSGNQIEKNEIGKACSTYGWKKGAHAGFWWGDLREDDHLGNPGVDGRIILKWIFKKSDGAWTGLSWFRIGTGGGLLWMR
jgi:hypothetical protein